MAWIISGTQTKIVNNKFKKKAPIYPVVNTATGGSIIQRKYLIVYCFIILIVSFFSLSWMVKKYIPAEKLCKSIWEVKGLIKTSCPK